MNQKDFATLYFRTFGHIYRDAKADPNHGKCICAVGNRDAPTIHRSLVEEVFIVMDQIMQKGKYD